MEQTFDSAGSSVSRRSMFKIEAAWYCVRWVDIRPNVEKPAPSMVAIAALLRNWATTEPRPAVLVGMVLTTTCFRGTSTCASVNEIGFLNVDYRWWVLTGMLWRYMTYAGHIMLARIPRQGNGSADGRRVICDQPQTSSDYKDRESQL